MRSVDKVLLFVRRMDPHMVFTTADVISETNLSPTSTKVVKILHNLAKYGFVEYIGVVYGTRNGIAWRTVGDETLKPFDIRSSPEESEGVVTESPDITLIENETERAVNPSHDNKE